MGFAKNLFSVKSFPFLTAISKKRSIDPTAVVRNEIKTCSEGMYDHICHTIERTQVLDDPFPHLIVNNFFPLDFYRHATALWPSSNHFVGKKRLILPITYGCLEHTQLTKQQKVFWRLFGEIMINRYLKPCIIKKFKPYLSQKLGMQDRWQMIGMEDFCNLREDALVLDKDTSTLEPHVDQLNIMAQIIIYFPADNQHEILGTSFYYGDPNQTPNDLYDAKVPENIKLAKKVPYSPNTLLVFIQSPKAWHGYERPHEVDPTYERRLFLAPIFFSPEFMERQYPKVYSRSIVDEYFFDHRFLSRKNWMNIWGAHDK